MIRTLTRQYYSPRKRHPYHPYIFRTVKNPDSIFTGILGTVYTILGNVELGYAYFGSYVFDDSLTFTQTISFNAIHNYSFSDSLTLTDTATISDDFNKTISDTLSLTQTITDSVIHTASINDSLASSDSISRLVHYSRTFNDSLSLTQTITDLVTHDESISQSLTITDTNSFNHNRVITLNDSLTLTQTLSFIRSHNLTVTDTLFIHPIIDAIDSSASVTTTSNLCHLDTFSILHNLFLTDCINYSYTHSSETAYLSVNDTLNLSQTVSEYKGQHNFESVNDTLILRQTIAVTTGNTYFNSLTHNLNLTQSISLGSSKLNVIDQSLNITQTIYSTVGFVYSKSLNDTLTFTQSITAGHRVGPITTFDTIALSQSLTNHKVISQSLIDQLSLSSSLTPKRSYNRTLSQTFTFKDNYTRNFNYTTVLPIPAIYYSIIPAKWVNRNYTALIFNADVVYLPWPELDNTISSANQLSVKRSITGSVFTYKKTTQTNTHKWDFLLTEAKYQQLLTFIESYETQPVSFVDVDKRVFYGFITNNLDANVSRNDLVEVSLELEGIRLG